MIEIILGSDAKKPPDDWIANCRFQISNQDIMTAWNRLAY